MWVSITTHIPNDTLKIIPIIATWETQPAVHKCVCAKLWTVLLSLLQLVLEFLSVEKCWVYVRRLEFIPEILDLYSLCQGTGIALIMLLVIVQAGIPRLCCTIRCNQEGTFRELGRALEAAFHCEPLCHLYLKATTTAGHAYLKTSSNRLPSTWDWDKLAY